MDDTSFAHAALYKVNFRHRYVEPVFHKGRTTLDRKRKHTRPTASRTQLMTRPILRFLLPTRHALAPKFFSIIFIFSATYSNAFSLDFSDQASIINAHLQATDDDKKQATLLANQALTIEKENSSSDNSGSLVKLWCASVITAPNTVNLVKCAQFRFEFVEKMSNPQPSKTLVRVQYAKESLVMLRAALEISSGKSSITEQIKDRIRKDLACYREVANGSATHVSCHN